MKRGNSIRMIFWGTLAVVSLIAGISGLFLFKSGHGAIGSIMKETKPLVETFNNLKKVKSRLTNGIEIVAKAKDDGIIASYDVSSIDSNGSKAQFTYKYSLNAGTRLLTMKYNVVDERIANLMNSYMIDAVAVSLGYKEDEVFEKFEMSDFENTTPKQGVNIKTVDNVTTVIINMDSCILDANIEINDISDFLTYEEAKNNFLGMSNNTNVVVSTEDVIIHLNMYETYYSIYIRDNSEIYSEAMYKSIESIINVLSGDEVLNEFVTLSPTFDNIDKESDSISIIYDSSGANAYTEFPDTNKILQVNVKLNNINENQQ